MSNIIRFVYNYKKLNLNFLSTLILILLSAVK